MNSSVVYFNGDWMPESEVRLSPLSVSVKYGLNVFEGIRCYRLAGRGDMVVFRLQEHLERLIRSMRMMGYAQIPSLAELQEIVVQTVARNRPDTDVHIRLAAYVVSDGFVDATGPVAMMCAVVPATSRSPEQRAVSAGVVSWRRPADDTLPARIKNGANYSSARLALMEARRNGHGEAIMLNERGKVAEAAAACIFLVRSGVLITPSVTQNILESITRETLIELGRKVHGLEVQEREVDRTELWSASEMFLAGSSYEVTPVTTIDHIELPGGAPGPLSKALSQTYMQVVRGELPEYRAWLTPVQGAL